MSVRIEADAEPIPGYRLIERIGGGGFGEVWKATAPGGLHKAIKFVSSDLNNLGDTGQRAEQELKALNRVKDVRHPYILSLERIERDKEDGQLVIVMELAERSLGDRYKECKSQGLPGIPRDELLRYMEEAAEALDLMNNTYQLQHLDIKPQNLFVMFNHVKVADFGLVKYLEGAQASVTGGLTPVYAAPETFDGMVTRFSDQYSLAIVYQELLTGHRPFAGTSIRQLIVQHLRDAPNVSYLPPTDQPVIQRALSKVPDQRFPTCREMVQLLRANSPPSSQGSGERPALRTSAKPEQTTPQVEADETPSALLETGVFIRLEDRLLPSSDPSAGTPTAIAPEGPLSDPSERPSGVEVTTGDGSLYPALVVGIGQVGMTVLQKLRGRIHERFGSPANLPCVRLLQLDTDPQIIRKATRGTSATALSTAEILLAELNRPSHYLKPREGRLRLDQWLNPRMVYRIPRSQLTAGIRALGRLAFHDNFRSIARRIQAELKACTDLPALKKVGRETGLGVRFTRPRVYVVTNLAGGTGSGMFLDLAYMIRAQLKRMGYERPEVVGVFFLPPADVTRTRAMALGNTYAALKELEYFSKPGVTFKAQYHEHDPVIEDGDAPFQRCALLPLAAEGDDPAKQKLVEVTSQVLFRELCSPMGRKLDELRSSSASRHGEAGPRLQSFGLYNLVWPRRTLLQQAARRICHALVTRWLSKDSKPIREQVREWVQERWQQQEMAADHFIMRLRQLAEDFLGASADTAFLNALGPMVQRFTPPVPTNPRQKQAPMPELHPEEVRYGFEQLLQLVGKSEDDNTADQPAKLVAVLREGADKLGSEWEQKLAMMPVSLIETPALRLAGAEEAIRQVTAMIEQVLEHHEPLAKELTARAAEAYDWLETFTNPKPGGRRSALQTRDVLALLRSYAKWRFQSVVLQQLAHVFLRLRGHLSDDLREVNFCRVRLTELQHLFESPPEAVAASEEATLSQAGRCLFPSGCTTLDDALGQYLTCLSPEAYLEADGKIEQAIKREYKALVHICLTPANILKKVETLMLETATEFAGAYLAEVEVTDMYLSQFSDNDADLANDLARCFAEAVPPLAPDGEDPAAGFHVLAAPGGPTADQLRDFLREALPGTKVHTADSDDDIVMYRECPILSLADLEQYGPVGRDAYCLMKATDNFTPHTRIDLPFE